MAANDADSYRRAVRRCKIPWSYALPEEFEKDNGYFPEDHLISLFLTVLGSEKFRYDFWKTVSRLYTDSFGKQIFDWCNENNCQLTGHAMMEDNLISQMYCTAGVMPFYQYEHIPGIDWLGRWIASPIIPKQVGSAARQMGRKHVLTEIYACCGWDMTFEEMKWMAEWQFVNGVNLICAHLEGYTILGLRKRHPAPVYEQAPGWSEYRHNDYISAWKLGGRPVPPRRCLSTRCTAPDRIRRHQLRRHPQARPPFLEAPICFPACI